jgi:hypothetical protein
VHQQPLHAGDIGNALSWQLPALVREPIRSQPCSAAANLTTAVAAHKVGVTRLAWCPPWVGAHPKVWKDPLCTHVNATRLWCGRCMSYSFELMPPRHPCGCSVLNQRCTVCWVQLSSCLLPCRTVAAAVSTTMFESSKLAAVSVPAGYCRCSSACSCLLQGLYMSTW